MTWTALGQGIGARTITALVVDPTNPDVVYVALDGTGTVFKTTNGGTTWTVSNAGVPTDSAGEAPAMSPSDPQTLYLGTVAYSESVGYLPKPGQIYRSTDGGATWSRLQVGVRLQPYSDFGNFAISAAQPNTIYASNDGGYGYVGVGMLVSTDGGATWSRINRGLSNLDITALGVAADGSTVLAGTFGNGTFQYSP